MLRHIKPGMLVFSVLYILLGLLLLLAPQAVADVFCIALGLLVVLCGLQSLYGYFKKDSGSIRAAVSLLLSLPTIALGMWALLCTVQSAMTFEWLLPLLFGLMLLVDGVVRAQSSFALAKRKGQKWWVGAAAQHCFAVVRGIAGVFSAAEQPQRGSFAAVRHLFTGRGHFEPVLHHLYCDGVPCAGQAGCCQGGNGNRCRTGAIPRSPLPCPG